MIGISSIGIVIALAVLAIVLLVLAKLCPGKRQRPEKWEKAEIMKQLLALSERENNMAVTAPSVRLHAPAPRQGMRPSNAQLKTTAKTTLPIRSKTR